jgi:hypothetical protein
MNETGFIWQSTLATILTGLIFWLQKNPKFTALNFDQKTTSRVVSLISAAVGAVAMSASFDAGVFTFRVTGLNWDTIRPALMSGGLQFALNESAYQWIWKRFKPAA